MNLSEREKKLLFILSILIIVALGYNYVYTPFVNKTNTLKSDIKNLESQLNSLEGGGEDKLKNDLKTTINSTQDLDELLPPELAQERAILALKELNDSVGISFQGITFSDVKPAKVQINNNNLNNDTSNSPKITDGTIIEMNVNVKCAANYNQIKNLLDKAAKYKNKIIVKDIILNSQGNSDVINGEFTLTFYGYKDSTKQLSEWSSSVSTGKSDIFK